MRFNSYPITLHSDGCPLHHRRTNCGSQFKRLLLVALLAATGAYGQEVTTSQGLRSLPAFEGLSSENNLRQAVRIAEITISELIADSTAVEEKIANVEKQYSALLDQKKSDQVKLDGLTAKHEAGLAPYVDRLEKFNQKNSALESETLQQRSEVAASNALHPTQRNSATVDRLNRWAAILSDRRTSLESERAVLELKREQLETLKTEILDFTEVANARLNTTNDRLQAEFKALQARQGLAFRQLKQCSAYAEKIQDKLRTAFNPREVHSQTLNGAMERIKALSAMGFDDA